MSGRRTGAFRPHYPIDVLVAADLRKKTLRQVTILLKNHPVKELYLPAGRRVFPCWTRWRLGLINLGF
ncbi:MAG: hypothetical protein ACLSEX_04140 [Blautia sp.]